MSTGAEPPAVGGPPHREDTAGGPDAGQRSPAPVTITPPAAGFIDVAGVDAVPEGTLLAVALPDGTRLCLFQQDGAIGAVSDRCTHAEFRMSEGSLHPDGTIECVWHGARFDCRTGAARRAPAVDPLPVHAVQVRDGRVLVSPTATPLEPR